jgi:type II secretory pathway pseudopilin PulG
MVQYIKSHARGITLIELVLYMALFTILVTGVLYSTTYLQKTIEYNAFEYKARENIYRQLTLLQQYFAIADRVEVDGNTIKMQIKDKRVTQELRDGRLVMVYAYPNQPEKEIEPYIGTKFETFSLHDINRDDTLYAKSLFDVEVIRKDVRGKTKVVHEYILFPKVDFSPPS